MSMASMYGFTGLPYAHNKQQVSDILVDILNDPNEETDVRIIACMVSLWSDEITMGKAEQLLVELDIFEDSQSVLSAYSKLTARLKKDLEAEQKKDCFANVKWCMNDIDALLDKEEVELSDEQKIEFIKLVERPLREAMIEIGWEVMGDLLDLTAKATEWESKKEEENKENSTENT